MPKFNKYYFDKIEDQSNYVPDFGGSCVAIINGKAIYDWNLAQPYINIITQSLSEDNCPYCKINIKISDTRVRFNPSDIFLQFKDEIRQYVKIWSCPICSYWRIHIIDKEYEFFDSNTHHLYASKLKEFNELLPNFFSYELSVSIRRDPSILHNISPKVFEKYVSELFKSNYDYSEVLHVGGPKDLGVDFFYINSKQEEWLVQVKRRGHTRQSEPVSTVIHLLGSMKIHGSDKGIIVSTADRFTSDAVKLVSKMKKRDCLVKLIDAGLLNRMIGDSIPKDLPIQLFKSQEFDTWRRLDRYTFQKAIKEFKINSGL